MFQLVPLTFCNGLLRHERAEEHPTVAPRTCRGEPSKRLLRLIGLTISAWPATILKRAISAESNVLSDH